MGHKVDILIKSYLVMLKIRLFEERIIALYPEQEMKTPVHLYIGQEAVAAGVCHYLTPRDYVFSTHRCHGHCIAKGVSLSEMMAEFYGKKTGCCEGKGGSMHLIDPAAGILATSAIVGGGIPLAVGAALSIKLQKAKKIAVVFFGDGAVDEGVFFESLNFAALKKLPILFVCENNLYATNSHIKKRQPLNNIFQKGRVFGIPGVCCDGNDLVRISKTAGQLIQKVRRLGGPYLLECRTYRWMGHVGPDCDEQRGCRPMKEVESWKRKCPIKKMEQYLLKKKMVTQTGLRQARVKIEQEIDAAVDYAKKSPFPQESDVYRDVYREKI
ncbi:MAG: thiamine pyrophosphate-dependent dehydrogenase E1 component subunit alpha [Candidatus Omnitrophota bacterium]